ncbi:QcrA and Rieske domain-containing protein [Fibrella forsythiae]|uniref:Rieske 2Fe-2S domain-containing protein n=1 Tax=Fibrella forsythiae TaxID=2817061 RepID=A0ABS3JCQ2_9BACT|nr:Rieske 2Fe-2S domain-containing protein [Fibrella forsythiae]MBO0947218.1 Rieske 2Fe-2S domain-containing protein [Fibrella forsythiae]
MENTTNLSSDTPLTRIDFMRLVGTSIGLIAFTNCVSACGKETGDLAPAASVDFTVNWAKSPYSNLQTKGGYVVEQGVIVAQTLAGDFVAVSAVCTHDKNTLVFQGTSNRFYCPAHQSAFSTTGAVQNGPAVNSLKTYTVTVNQATGDIRVNG